VLIALATNLAYGFGRQMVAGLVGASPEPFPATVNIATILLSPVLFLMALAIGGFFIFLISAYVGMLASIAFLASESPGKWKRGAIWECRFFAVGIAVFGSMTLLSRSNGYAGWAGRRTASYLYHFDMYREISHGQTKDEKVAFLPDGRLCVGKPSKDGNGYDFTILMRSSEHEN